jgi:drug/metabolite transporter (DMT)-like permease
MPGATPPGLSCPCSGTAAADLMLHLIGQQHGRRLAVSVADQMVYTAVRQGSATQRLSLWSRHGIRNDHLVRAITRMEQCIEDPLPSSQGILLVVLATLAFAASDVVTKHLTMLYPVAPVLAARYAVNLVLVTVVLWPRMGADIWRVRRGWLVTLRGLCLALASLTMGLALQVMPVGETVAIIYLAPFVVLLLSAPVLGERVGLAGWQGAVLGFCCVLLILRPGGGLDPWGVAMALVNVGLASAYHLLTRLLSRTESTIAMLWHTALIGTIGFGIGATFTAPLGDVAGVDLALMLVLGVLATLGHFLFTAAYRKAPAALFAPVNYLHLVWAGGLGWLVFAHVPDHAALPGMAMVCASGAWAALARGR